MNSAISFSVEEREEHDRWVEGVYKASGTTYVRESELKAQRDREAHESQSQSQQESKKRAYMMGSTGSKSYTDDLTTDLTTAAIIGYSVFSGWD
jgi:hypothetical protein